MSVQLGLGLNRRQGGFNPFTPTHLNPYLLFDTRTSMLGEFESPTLDLNPAVPSSLDVITATRSGVATYTDADGLIQTADPNTVRVDYVQGEELTPTVYQRVRYTDFSSGWSAANGATVSGTGDYNGSITKEITAVGYSVYFTSVPTTASQVYNVSFYARLISGSASTIGIYRQYTETSFTNISLTSEWQRFDVAVTASGSTVNFGIAKSSGATDPVVFEITQPQFTEGSELRDFVPNTTGSPKFIASATYADRVPMMLIEPSATNFWSYSDLSSGMINNSYNTLVNNYADSPLGPNTASQLVATTSTTSNEQVRVRTNGFTVNSGESTVSLFAKADTRSQIYIHIEGFDGGNRGAFFDLLDGSVFSVSTGITANTEYVSDGWYRVSFTFTTTSDLTGDVRIIIANDGTAGSLPLEGTESVLLTGLQVESGSVATSYIPTSGSAVTRNSDNLVIDGAAFSDFYNPTEGTFYLEAIERARDNRAGFITGQGTSQFFLYHERSGDIFSYDGGSFVKLSGRPVNELFRAAVTYTPTTKTISMNGAVSTVDVHNGNWAAATILNIGWANSQYIQLNGHIKRLIYWPTHSDSL